MKLLTDESYFSPFSLCVSVCAKKQRASAGVENQLHVAHIHRENSKRALLAWQIVNLTNCPSCCLGSLRALSTSRLIKSFYVKRQCPRLLDSRGWNISFGPRSFHREKCLRRLGRRQSHFEIVNGDAYHIF